MDFICKIFFFAQINKYGLTCSDTARLTKVLTFKNKICDFFIIKEMSNLKIFYTFEENWLHNQLCYEKSH